MEPDTAPSGDVHSQDPEHVILAWAVKPALQVQYVLPAGAEDPVGHEDPAGGGGGGEGTVLVHRSGPLYPSRAPNCSASMGTQASVKSACSGDVQEDASEGHHR